jgi:ribosomal subunit interface protein
MSLRDARRQLTLTAAVSSGKASQIMQLTVTGKQVEIGEALRRHVESCFTSILAKYFKMAIEAHVVVAKEAGLIRAEGSLHVSRAIVVNAGAALDDAYVACAAVAERLAKQLRYKRCLRDHHAEPREPVENVRDAVLAPVAEEAKEGPSGAAAVSAELPRLTDREAAMRMDLADAPTLPCRNRTQGGQTAISAGSTPRLSRGAVGKGLRRLRPAMTEPAFVRRPALAIRFRPGPAAHPGQG